MFLNSLVWLVFINFMCADYVYPYHHQPSIRCPMPDNEKYVTTLVVQSAQIVKVSCRRGYTIMGAVYVICIDGHWNVPLPICIKSGCQPLEVRNSVNVSYHNGAWTMFFCLPRHDLVGSSVLYCDGNHWNATAPKCIDSSAESKTSCDFEKDLCDWKQDKDTQDFNWRRINSKIHTKFWNMGPSYDHTLGKNGNGYYMYIKIMGVFENDTALLISPVYDESRTENGCFVFYYHMYGSHIGGLRVYQKPNRISMQDLLRLGKTGRNRFLLFEKWGNQGDFWFTSSSTLLNVYDDFQIVIEGIKGNSSLNSIAIDDVALLQGKNCTNLRSDATPTPPTVSQTTSTTAQTTSTTPVPTATTTKPAPTISTTSSTTKRVMFTETVKVRQYMPPSHNLISPKPQVDILAQTTSTTAQTTSTTPVPTAATTKRAPTISTTSSTTKRVMFTETVKVRQYTPPSHTLISPKPQAQTTSKTAQTTSTTPVPTAATTKRAPTISTTSSTTMRVMFTETVKVRQYTPPSHNLISPKPQGTKGATIAVIVLLVLGVCCGILYGGYYLRKSRGNKALARPCAVRFLKSDEDNNI